MLEFNACSKEGAIEIMEALDTLNLPFTLISKQVSAKEYEMRTKQSTMYNNHWVWIFQVNPDDAKSVVIDVPLTSA